MESATTIESSWQVTFTELRKYLNKYKVSVEKAPAKYNKWIAKTKEMYRNGELGLGQISSVEMLYCWSWDHLTDWDITYYQYSDFITDKEFHPELSDTDNRETRLRKWADQNREMYSDNTLTFRQKGMLADLPGWKWSEIYLWTNRFGQLSQFIKRFGRYPQNIDLLSYNFEKNLHIWMTEQKKVRLSLTKFQTEQLQSLPDWDWTIPRYKHRFITPSAIIRLKKYSEKYGQIEIARDIGSIETELTLWTNAMIGNYDRKKLTSSDVDILRVWITEIDFEESWKENVQIYLNFLETYNRQPDANIPNEKHEIYLLNWMDSIKTYRDSGRLSSDKIDWAKRHNLL